MLSCGMSTTGGDDPARQSLKVLQCLLIDADQLCPQFSTLTEDDIKSKNKRDLIILLTEAREEINVLTQALAVKAGDIGLERDGDLRVCSAFQFILIFKSSTTTTNKWN